MKSIKLSIIESMIAHHVKTGKLCCGLKAVKLEPTGLAVRFVPFGEVGYMEQFNDKGYHDLWGKCALSWWEATGIDAELAKTIIRKRMAKWWVKYKRKNK